MASDAVFSHENSVRDDRRRTGIESLAFAQVLREPDEVILSEHVFRLREHVALATIGPQAETICA